MEDVRKVLLIGPYPPPYGGLAVQLHQWQRYLTAKKEYQCEVLNIGEGRASLMDGCRPVTNEWDFLQHVLHYGRQGYLLHLFTNGHNRKSWLSCLVSAAAGLLNKRRTLLVLGSGNVATYLSQAGFMDKMIARWAMRLAGQVICRNEATQRALMKLVVPEDRLSVMPGFLGVERSSELLVPDHVQQFMNEHDPVLGATASVEPEYGISLMIDALARLRMRYPKAGLVLMGPSREQVEQRYGPLSEYILATGGLPHNAVMATMKCLRIFLRPTLFDGDSISVREASAMGIPVVASNVGLRPEGVLLFPAGELTRLLETILMALNHGCQPLNRQETQEPATTDLVLALYDRLFMANARHDRTHVAAGSV